MAAWVPAAIVGGSALASSLIGALSNGKGGSTDYQASHEQKKSYEMAYPFMQQIMGYGQQNAQNPNLGVPQMGAPPPIYDVPSGEGLMPTSGWYNSIAPEVRQGLWEPWNEAANQLQMNMGSRGQLGSSRGGYSGAAGTALGKLYADAGQQVGTQAWNMMAPGQQALWQANLGQNVAEYNTSLMPYQNNFQANMSAWQQPFQQVGGLLTGSYPTGVYSQNQSPLAGAASGAMMGGLAAYNMFGNQNQQQPTLNPYAMANQYAANPYDYGYGGGYGGYGMGGY